MTTGLIFFRFISDRRGMNMVQELYKKSERRVACLTIKSPFSRKGLLSY
ncbi:hypothetical protein CHCC14814_0705 [Bacillus paralicheniformis]|nr:hypothetical protein CHCC14814_0705 [Bacillus paralicheniformis]